MADYRGPEPQSFNKTGQMLEKIGAFASKTINQCLSRPVNSRVVALESLALAYRRTLNMLEGILGYS
jgi:hypothetical protein